MEKLVEEEALSVVSNGSGGGEVGVGERVAGEDDVEGADGEAGNDGEPAEGFSGFSPDAAKGGDEGGLGLLADNPFEDEEGDAEDEKSKAIGDEEGAPAIFIGLGTETQNICESYRRTQYGPDVAGLRFPAGFQLHI